MATIRKILPSMWLRQPRIDQAVWKELEDAGGVKLPYLTRSDLEKTMVGYILRRSVFEEGERPGVVRSQLEELASALGRLEKALEVVFPNFGREGVAFGETIRLGANTEIAPGTFKQSVAFGEIVGAATRHKVDPWRPGLEGFLVEIKTWKAVTTTALEGLPVDQGGAHGDPYIGEFLCRAHAAFAEAGGRGIYTKSALNFLAAACKAVGYRVHSEEALAQTLKESRRSMARGRSADIRDDANRPRPCSPRRAQSRNPDKRRR